MPAQRRLLELRRLLLGEQVEVVERVEQADAAELAQRKLLLEEVARLDSAGEPSVCRALGCHVPREGPAERPYSPMRSPPAHANRASGKRSTAERASARDRETTGRPPCGPSASTCCYLWCFLALSLARRAFLAFAALTLSALTVLVVHDPNASPWRRCALTELCATLSVT